MIEQAIQKPGNKMIKIVPYYGTLLKILQEIYLNVELPLPIHFQVETILLESGDLTASQVRGKIET